MSHKVKKNKKKKANRGPTFVGLRPMIEKGKKERKEQEWSKHKNRWKENY